MKWITAVEQSVPAKQRTRLWNILTSDAQHFLGQVKWYTGWRRYAFYPWPGCLFEQDCLRNIANFLDEKTREHKAQRAMEKVRHE